MAGFRPCKSGFRHKCFFCVQALPRLACQLYPADGHGGTEHQNKDAKKTDTY